MDTIDPKDVKAGDEVFVIYHNPHTPSVANIKSAEIVQHPKDPEKLALFLHESFHLIEEDDAFFPTEQAAEKAFNEYYGDTDF
ncbi:transcriptional regulator SplA domain-containing protein [Neobacillus terrae]|uniref:transcriptional regulator SplA domain-containing protein n=1 Tax=Neobacillus terrae TaxID=3034837 RepID=UPI00140DA279|nr:transcriptional regulator SplA domain-containing protein [Neobacillus terrae]NHM33770.1 transcriptional regulator [Neobacillus terrae]